jgi:ribosomal protein S18 acetylase RimI-like enzyme
MRPATLEPLRLRRRISADDLYIARIAERAFAEYSRRPGDSTVSMARSGSTWVACREERLLGFAVVRGEGAGVAELCAIAVDELARGQGVGRALLTQVERALSAEGIRELSLHTAQANLSAMELFLKHGFRVERRLPRFYRGVFEACAMRKRVSLARP